MHPLIVNCHFGVEQDRGLEFYHCPFAFQVIGSIAAGG
jgi:hypothetical protein